MTKNGIAALLVATILLSISGIAKSRAAYSKSVVCTSNRQPKPLTSRRFSFPRDDGRHDGFAVEWWRTFGRLHSADQHTFDVSVIVSRYETGSCLSNTSAAKSRWAASHVLALSYELLDEDTLQVQRASRVVRESAIQGFAKATDLGLTMNNFTFSESAAHSRPQRHLILDDTLSNSFDLTQGDLRLPVLLGPRGIIQTGSCEVCQAYGYVAPRSKTTGVIKMGDQERAVTGSMWFEHEFAYQELGQADVGWDRFEIAFDDGRFLDVRLTRNFLQLISATSGVLIATDGTITFLHDDDVLEHNALDGTTWTSTASGVKYSTNWNFRIPFARLFISAEVLTADQEDRADLRRPFYWGAIDVIDQAPRDGDKGHGFIEMVGYRHPVFL